MSAPSKYLPEKPDESNLPLLDHYAFDEVRSLMSEKFAPVLKIYLEDTAHRLATLEALIAAHEAASGVVHQAHAIRSSATVLARCALRGLPRRWNLSLAMKRTNAASTGRSTSCACSGM
jgi:HPt (histidine-containing phosphotransfer) domain-containing protein